MIFIGINQCIQNHDKINVYHLEFADVQNYDFEYSLPITQN